MTTRITHTLAAALLGFSALTSAGSALAETIAVTGARILTMGPAGEIASGTVVATDGKITAVGADVQVPSGARIIDGAGRIVTPGIIAANSTLSGVEVSAHDAAEDLSAADPDLSAAFDVQYGLNPNSTLIPIARTGGVTRAIVTPELPGGDEAHGIVFAGQAAAIHLAPGYELLMKPGVAMVLALGEDATERSGGTRGTALLALKGALEEARAYHEDPDAYEEGESRPYRQSRADLKALGSVIRGEQPLLIRVHRAADILQVLRLAEEERVRIILEGAEEAWMVADRIAAAKVPVVVNTLANLPAHFETLGATLENAAKLHAAGVTVAIQGSRAGHYARQTRYNAGNAVAQGMPPAAALAAITINPARIFGLDKQVGSIEPGKEADLVVWSGDPLEISSQPEAVFIKGVETPLETRGRALAERYRNLDPDGYPPAYR
ncbi:amidohydrolase family protein [Indioceanicola profundi]|uniref:amidohydrolase family protein n=1 Tax=Indioceanicola profundi TaxID=2220096 RepID=UPI000E6AA5CB|nr:amidohydrolase family protein [Indioceanicola profundi]